MSALDEVRQFIIQKLNTSGFGSSFPDVPIQVPNQPFATPPDKTYINVSIIHGESEPAQITQTRQVDRHVGILQFDIVTPLDIGTKKQNDVADYLSKIFRRSSIQTASAGTLIFRTPNYIVVGSDRGADRLVVRIPFRRDEQF